MTAIFIEIFYRPLFNALIFLYNTVSFNDLGVAIIVLTALIRLILLPVFYKSAKDSAIMGHLAPKIKEIQKSHKDDKEKQMKEMMALYREHRVNPLSGFFLLLIQLPVLIALYRVFWGGITFENLNAYLYSFIDKPAVLGHYFLGFLDLSRRSLAVAVLAALAQFFQGKLSLSKTAKSVKNLTAAESMSKQMAFIGPTLTFAFLYVFNLPAAIGLYWLTTSIFSVIQQIIINKRLSATHEVEKEIKEHGITNQSS